MDSSTGWSPAKDAIVVDEGPRLFTINLHDDDSVSTQAFDKVVRVVSSEIGSRHVHTVPLLKLEVLSWSNLNLLKSTIDQ